MYRIGEILEQALLLHDCVVLPSIGAFIVEHIPPIYDERLNIISPSGQRISFNAAIVDRDGILDRYYARTLGLSIRRARLVVDSDVNLCRNHLYQSGSLTLGSNLGTFTLQESGELLFSPISDRQGLRSIDSYGLYPQCCLLPVISTQKPTGAIIPTKHQDDRRYWTIRIHKTATNWVAAIVISILCLLPISSDNHIDRYSAGFVPYGWLNETNKVTQQQSPTINEKIMGSSEPSSSLDKDYAKDSSTESNQLANAHQIISLEEALEQGRYTIVLGVFKSAKRAEQFIHENSAEDSPTKEMSLQILQDRSRYLVISGILPSQEQANQRRRSISSLDPSFSGVWIYTI